MKLQNVHQMPRTISKTGMVSNFKLLIIYFEWNTSKWTMILDMKRKIYGDKRSNRKEFEQTT